MNYLQPNGGETVGKKDNDRWNRGKSTKKQGMFAEYSSSGIPTSIAASNSEIGVVI